MKNTKIVNFGKNLKFKALYQADVPEGSSQIQWLVVFEDEGRYFLDVWPWEQIVVNENGGKISGWGSLDTDHAVEIRPRASSWAWYTTPETLQEIKKFTEK
jgi:hypothetical protein